MTDGRSLKGIPEKRLQTGTEHFVWPANQLPFLHEAIFDPLGMDDTGCDHNGAILPRRASGYRRMGDDLENASYIDMTWTHAAGVLYSTVEDLAKWDQALREGKLIGPESTEAFSTPFKDDYAYGGRVRDRSGRLEVDHTGSIHGFNTYIVRYPEDGVCVAVLSNVEPTPRFRIARDLAGIVLGESVEFPRAPEVVAIDPEAFDALAGRYQLGPSFFLTATRAEDRYYIEATEHSMLEIFPESETEYFVKFMDARLIFKKDESGQVTHVIVRHYDGRELKAEHLDDDPTEATERTEADADEPPARDEASDDEPEAK